MVEKICRPVQWRFDDAREHMWSRPDDILATDACLEGCGGLCENVYFHTRYPDFIKCMNLCIHALEMLTVTVAIR